MAQITHTGSRNQFINIKMMNGMKKVLHALVAVSVLVLLLVSCDKEPEFIPEIVLSQTEFNLPDNATVIEVEVKANVEFGVIVSGKWITRNTTKDLTSTKLFFNIAKNESYDKREDYILIKQKNGELTIPIHVVQSQKDAVVFSNKKVEITPESQVLEVAFRTNVEVEVIIPDVAQSWVSYAGTKALRDETLLLNIAENTSEEIRITEIYVKNKAASLQDTLNITQFGKGTNFIFVKQMGTLGTILNQTQKDTITKMIVKGEINAADFEVMKLQMPNLLYLDLEEVICEGDKIPKNAFGAFRQSDPINTKITTIILPTSITTIENNAFSYCTGLTGPLILPAGLTTIKSAFTGCSGLTGSLILPEGLTEIGDSAFYGCSGFTGDLIIPDKVKTIQNAAFGECSGFNGSLHLPDGLTTINQVTFRDCSGLTGPLILPEGLTMIDRYAFMNCSGFTGDLIIPDKVTFIGHMAFFECSGFNGTLHLPDELTTLIQQAFMFCSGFTGSLTIPDGVTIIGYDTFYGCTGFNGSLNLPDGLTAIGEKAFYNCGFTGELRLPAGLTEIYGYAFYNCSGFTGELRLPAGLTEIYRWAFAQCSGFTGSLIIPDGVILIGDTAFFGCSGFTGELRLPAGLTEIYSWAFTGCSGFTGSLTIPDGVTLIGNNAFSGCRGFTGSLTIPDGVTSIGEYAFSGCRGFSGKIFFPLSLSDIGERGFLQCNAVEAFQFPHTTPLTYSEDMLPGGATVEVPTAAVDTYKATDGWKNHNVVGY